MKVASCPSHQLKQRAAVSQPFRTSCQELLLLSTSAVCFANSDAINEIFGFRTTLTKATMETANNQDPDASRQDSIMQTEDLLRQISEQQENVAEPSNSYSRLSLIDDNADDDRKPSAVATANGSHSRTSTTVSTPRGVTGSPRTSPYAPKSKLSSSTNSGSAGADAVASNANLKPGAQAVGPGEANGGTNGGHVPDSLTRTFDKIDQKIAASGGGGDSDGGKSVLSMAPPVAPERTASQVLQQDKTAISGGVGSSVPLAASSVLKKSTLPNNYDRSALLPGAQSVSPEEVASSSGLSLAAPLAESESAQAMVISDDNGNGLGLARRPMDNVNEGNGGTGGGGDEENQSEKFQAAQNTLYKKPNSKDSGEFYPIATPISSKLVTEYDDVHPPGTSSRGVTLGSDGEEVTAVVATLDDGSGWLHNKKIQGLIVLLVLGLVAALVVAFTVGGDEGGTGGPVSGTGDAEVDPDDFYFQVGGNLDGDVSIQFGLSISMNDDGTRIAIADREKVSVYEIQAEEGETTVVDEKTGAETTETVTTFVSKELASPILGITESEGRDLPSIIELPFRSPIITKISANGDFVAVGFPLHDAVVGVQQDIVGNSTDVNGDFFNSTDVTSAGAIMKHVGKVEIYRLVLDGGEGSWEQVGNSLIGIEERGYFGASLSLSEDGGIVAVGAPASPGQGGYAQVFYLNKGSWESRGSSVRGNDLDLSVYSVSLSGDGSSVALGGIPNSDEGSVAKVFKWFAGDWIEQGSGFGRTIGETSYLAELSADGTIVVVSNYYITDAETNTGAGLDVRAFRWQENLQDWQQLGANMHEGFTAQKSGYFITLSRDGKRIGMGDPGRRFGDGAATGHAHIWEYHGSDWVQIGPNIWGEAAGDQFGYSVSISGDGKRLSVSAPYNRGSGQERGRIQVYQVNEDAELIAV